MPRIARLLVLGATASLLAACAHQPQMAGNSPVYSPSRQAAAQDGYGVVSQIQPLAGSQASTGNGAIVGGLVGAVVGRQFGSGGSGRMTGTMLGAFGGAVIGDQIERQQRGGSRSGVRISVQLDHGGMRSFDYAEAGGLRVGDRVRIDNNQLFRL